MLRWNEIGRICFCALGGASIFGAIGLANIIAEKKIGRNLLIPTKSVHKHDAMRCWLTQIEDLAVPKHEILYLRMLGVLDNDIFGVHQHLQTRPAKINMSCSQHLVKSYAYLEDICRQFVNNCTELNNNDTQLLRSVLTSIKQTSYTVVLNALQICTNYEQFPFVTMNTPEKK